MSKLHDSDSKTDAAYQTLRREILSARLPANMALRPQALKEAYGLSWTPVREALARLEAERLVVYKRNHGFAVALVRGFTLHCALFFLVRKLLGIECAKRICAKVVCIRHVSPTLGLS